MISKPVGKSALFMIAVSVSSMLAQSTSSHGSHSAYPGAVFVMTNNVDSNQILRFGRKADGTLVSLGSTFTGGRGSGGAIDPLGSQNSLLLTPDSGFLLAVNSASGSLSSFAVEGANIELVDVQSTGGSAPNAIAQWNNLVYVLNVAGNSSIVGFHLEDGHLKRIASSTRYLSTALSGGSSINFTLDGKFLLATERLTGQIDAYPVNTDGTLGTAVVTKYPGIFDLAVSAGGTVVAVGSPTITNSIVNSDGSLTLTSAPTLAGGGACWVVVTPNGAFAYASNPGGSLIDGYSVLSSGILTPVGSGNVGVTSSNAKPLDLAISFDGKFLYSDNAGNGSIAIWGINADGTLTAQTPFALPAVDAAAGFNGIAAY